MAITMSKELLIRIPEPLYRRLKEVCAHEYKSMSAFVRELLKESIDETLSSKDWDDVRAARKNLKTGKSVAWRANRRS